MRGGEGYRRRSGGSSADASAALTRSRCQAEDGEVDEGTGKRRRNRDALDV